MRENRTCGSEGGEAQSLPYPYPAPADYKVFWMMRRRALRERGLLRCSGRVGVILAIRRASLWLRAKSLTMRLSKE